MKQHLRKLAASFIGIALAVSLAGCGGGDEAATSAPASAEATEAEQASESAEATEAAEIQATEDAETDDAAGPATEGTGGTVDAGYMVLDVPDGISWDVGESPYDGYAVARVHVGSFPNQVGKFAVSTTTMADSLETAWEQGQRTLDSFGGGYADPVEVTYGGLTYLQTFLPSDGRIYLISYDAATDLYIEHVIEATDDGSAFTQPEAVESILNSITYQIVDRVE
jgi:hypothetical protein